LTASLTNALIKKRTAGRTRRNVERGLLLLSYLFFS